MNRIYEVPESRPFWKKTALSVGMTVSAGLALLLVTAVLVATQIYAAEMAAWAGLGRSYNFVIQLLRLPLVIAVVICAAALVYWIAPDHGRPLRLISPGVIVFGLTWTAFTTGFASYIANFSSYGATYGALAGVVVLLLWTQISSLLLLCGAQLGAILDGNLTRTSLEAKAANAADRHTQSPGRIP